MSELNNSVLIIEDDAQIRKFISYVLEQEGLQVFMSDTANEGLRIFTMNNIDLVLLDMGLPDFDGIEVIKKIRQWSETPIIVISARDQDKEKANALDTGADDYLTKPFSTTELLARIRVALRHLKFQARLSVRSTLSVKDLEMDVDKHRAMMNNKEIHLTPMEYKLLLLFMQNPNKVLTTKYILKEVWGYNYSSDTQALRALMSQIRRKIEKNPATPQYIVTEIGVGYRLKDD